MRQSQASQCRKRYDLPIEDIQLFNRLKRMIDATVKMECLGCHKLIPTIQFYDHLINKDSDLGSENDHPDSAYIN